MAATDESEKKSTFREYYEALLIAFIFVNFARIFVFQAFKIPSGSMEDNLKVGDHILVNKFIYGPATAGWKKLMPLRDIRRKDIIVFRYPRGPETDFVKRVIGLPGDTVSIRDRVVYINGKPLERTLLLGRFLRDFKSLPEATRVGLDVAEIGERALSRQPADEKAGVDRARDVRSDGNLGNDH